MAFTLPDSIPSRAIGDTRRSCAAAMVTTDMSASSAMASRHMRCRRRNFARIVFWEKFKASAGFTRD